MQIEQVSENTLMISYERMIDPQTSDRILGTLSVLQQQMGDVIIDAIPSYCSILLMFDVRKMALKDCQRQIEDLLEQYDCQSIPEMDIEIELPVYYGEEVALDAIDLCKRTGLSWQQVVELHCQVSYRVYAIGFAPGFAYLGHVDPKLVFERKSTPRLQVPKGSVAIAGQQTAVYPKASPGGWHIIGRTPVPLVNFDRENLSLFHIGARVRFQPISKQRYLELGGDFEQKTGKAS